MSRLFVPIAAVGLAAGVALALMPSPFYARGLMLLGLLAASVGAAIVSKRWPRARFFALALACALVGNARAASSILRATPLVIGGPALLEVEVTAGCRPALTRCVATVHATRRFEPRLETWVAADWKVRLLFESVRQLPVPGDRMIVRANVRRYERGLHRFAFDGAGWARRRGVDAVASTRHEVAWLPRCRSTRCDAARALDLQRGRFERVLLRATGATTPDAESDAAGVLLAMTTGSKSLLSSETRNRFGAAGIAHVLAVSGMHLGLITLVWFGASWRLFARIPWLANRIPAQRVAAGLTIPMIIAYVLFTGAPVSALRAGLMAVCMLAPAAAGRPGASLHGLSVATIVLLFARPEWLGDLGFQLSVAATLSLVLLKLPRSLAKDADGAAAKAAAGSADFIRASLIVSTVTAFATIPSLVWTFGTVPLTSQLGNLVLVPPLALIALPSAVIGAIGELSFGVGDELISLSAWVVEATLRFAEFGEIAFCQQLTWGRPSRIGAAAWIGLACISPWMFRMDIRRLLLAFSCATAMLSFDLPPAWAPTGTMALHAIPVGQGDATLIVFPAGTTMLIDAGGSGFGPNRTGEALVLPYLRGLGYGHIDVLANTHGDADHVGGLVPLTPILRPSQVWAGEPELERWLDASLYKASLDVRAEYITPHEVTRQILIDGDVLVDVYPSRSGLGSNDSGLTMRACFGEVCAFLAGDVEEAREAMLVASPIDMNASYLKVGHHGSRTSTSEALLDRVAPSVAVLHLATGNSFGFPHAEVMDRFHERSIPTYRTDTGSAVVFETDGDRLWRVHARPQWTRGNLARVLNRP